MRDVKRSSTPKTPDSDVSPWSLAGLGVQFAVALVLFGYLGQWLDQRFGTAPLFLLTGVLAGAGGTFFVSYRRIIAPRTPTTASRSPATGEPDTKAKDPADGTGP